MMRKTNGIGLDRSNGERERRQRGDRETVKERENGLRPTQTKETERQKQEE